MLTEREAAEVFHLLFLRGLSTRVDKSLLVLKGGCNLRFFYRSVRYSEDLDLDTRKIAVGSLRNQVDRLLASSAFRQSLRAQSLEIQSTSAPKQTETTQRWKIRLILSPTGQEVPTKIEFSRRLTEDGDVFDSIGAELITRYRLYPVMLRHYGANAAFAQKVGALAHRAVTQARDVFDLAHLLDAGAGRTALPPSVAGILPAAIENALAVGFEEFAGQVLAYLEPAYQADFRDRRPWERLQARVVTALEGLLP